MFIRCQPYPYAPPQKKFKVRNSRRIDEGRGFCEILEKLTIVNTVARLLPLNLDLELAAFEGGVGREERQDHKFYTIVQVC